MIKIALSFDDGRFDNFVVANQILEPLNIPATFNVTIGYIVGDNKAEKPSDHKPMSISNLRDLAKNNLFEIASHGYEHNNDVDNLINGANIIREKLGWKMDKKIGIVSPHSEFDVMTINDVSAKFKNNNISYLRVGKRFEKFVFVKKAVRKINRKLNIPFLYSWSYKDSYIKNDDKFLLYCAGVIKDNRLNEVKKLIDYAVKKNKSYILNFHSILRPGEIFYDDLFTWDYDDFYKLCLYLKDLEKNNKIKICKTLEMLPN